MEVLISRNKQLDLVFNNPEAAISLYKTEHQQVVIKSKIAKDIISMSEMINVGKKITADQIITVSSMIYEDEQLKTLKPCEIEECLKRGIKGEYGPLYDCLDAPTIFFWFREYLAQKYEAIELLRQKESGEHKQALKEQPQDKNLSEIATSYLKKIQDRLKESAKAAEKPPAPPREKTPAELEFDEYMAEFMKLFASQPQNADLFPRFVDYAGKKLSLEEYCNKRWEEVRAVWFPRFHSYLKETSREIMIRIGRYDRYFGILHLTTEGIIKP